MTTPGSSDPDPGDGGGSRGRRRVLLVGVGSVVALVIALGTVVLLAQGPDRPDPLGSEAPALADFTMRTDGPCTFQPDRGGLVAHFDVSARDAGRFTVDLEAVTDEGMDDLDVTTTHAVRVTVPFHGGRSRQQFDVVVPLTAADYRDGYRQCRYTINPTGPE